MIIEADSADEVVALLCRLFEAPSFRGGFPHLLDRRSRVVRMSKHLIWEATPEQFASVMNGKGIRPKQYIKRKMTAEAAARVQEHLKRTAAAPGLTQEETAAAKLADLIECAMDLVRPNDTNWFEALDALWWAEVEAPRIGYKYDKSDHRFIAARKARKVLCQRTDPNDRSKLKRGRPEGSKAKPAPGEAKREQRMAKLAQQKMELEQRTAELVRASRASLTS